MICDFSGAKGGAFDRALSKLVNFSASAENVQPVLKTTVTKTRAVTAGGGGGGEAGREETELQPQRHLLSQVCWALSEDGSGLLSPWAGLQSGPSGLSVGTHHPHVQPPPPPSRAASCLSLALSLSALLGQRGPEHRAHCCALRPGSAGRETYISPRPVRSKAAHVLESFATVALKVLTMFEEGPYVCISHQALRSPWLVLCLPVFQAQHPSGCLSPPCARPGAWSREAHGKVQRGDPRTPRLSRGS